MTPSIELSDIRLTERRADEITATMVQAGVGWYTLAVTVRNRSGSPFYVISHIRRMSYNSSSRVLTVEFTNREPSQPTRRPAHSPLPPRYTLVEAGESVVLTSPVSSPIVFLESAADGSLRERPVRILEDVDSVQVRVAFDKELPARADLTALQRLDRSGEWGEVAEQSWRPSIGTQDDGRI